MRRRSECVFLWIGQSGLQILLRNVERLDRLPHAIHYAGGVKPVVIAMRFQPLIVIMAISSSLISCSLK